MKQRIYLVGITEGGPDPEAKLQRFVSTVDVNDLTTIVAVELGSREINGDQIEFNYIRLNAEKRRYITKYLDTPRAERPPGEFIEQPIIAACSSAFQKFRDQIKTYTDGLLGFLLDVAQEKHELEELNFKRTNQQVEL